MNAPVAFLDTETLGLDADVHPVWEVGLILPSGRELCWQVEVSQRDITLAHPQALEITRFEERYNKTAEGPWSREQVAAALAAFIEPGVHLAGMVVSFDEERLRRMLWEHGLVPPWHYHIICVETLAVGALVKFAADLEDNRAGLMIDQREIDRLRAIATPPWDSKELSMAVGVDPSQFDRHTALGDARWARAVYEAIMP